MRNRSGSFDDFLKTIAYVVGGIMGLGAMFGALNTMYSAVAPARVERSPPCAPSALAASR